MKNRFFLATFLLFLLATSRGMAQEVIPTYSDYLTDNLYLLHPSMAGASNFNKIRLTARQQWFDVKNAPSLQTLSVHGRMGERVGVGGIAFNDQNGNFSRRGIYATFAYHLLFSRSELDLNQLSFGISAGIIQHSLDQSGFTGFDPAIGGDNLSDFYGNMDVGISYYYFDFFAHLTAKNLLGVRRDLFYSDAVPNNQRKYLVSAGYVFNPRGRPWSYEPSLLFQWREQTAERAVDVNFKVYRDLENALLFGGLSYRRSFEGAEYTTAGQEVRSQQLQYVTPFLGMEYRRFLFAYTYSHQVNSVVLTTQGFHQITLGYNFGENRARYDCVCPAVNQNSR
jgi:type IX secretion system PorP/SprF family membrane protein